MRIAIVDLGTNTFNLLVCEKTTKGKVAIVRNDKFPVKLGEGGINQRIIREAPYQRALDTMQIIKNRALEWQAEKFFAFATSAIRSTGNGKALAAEIKERTGIRINIISGNREAELIYKGVARAITLGEQISLIMDIGGGSTEFILANRNGILWKKSYLLGGARLLERFSFSEPITADEQKQLVQYLRKSTRSLFEAIEKHRPVELIGSSGSFDTFADLIAHRFHQPDLLKGKKSYRYNLSEFREIVRLLTQLNREQRTKLPGMIAMRVDMIVVAALFAQFILDEVPLTKFRLSTYALKEGVLSELFD
jgi:exopolyphosphatase / guanosine-5'-triphosphate,3'-diphosphate pyrophosphatase